MEFLDVRGSSAPQVSTPDHAKSIFHPMAVPGTHPAAQRSAGR
jgi:hypothetical protein